MIRIQRAAEPAHLAATRAAQLCTVSSIKPERTGAHDKAYQSVKPDLVRMQHQKCCYCERIVVPIHNDVEHYRPFATYWWLAWTWENLLFACAACNRTGAKGDQFPLAAGSARLTYAEQPPGREGPLLVDPTSDDPRKHIQFVLIGERWAPIGKDERGRKTIEVLNLDRDEARTDFERHAKTTVAFVVRDLRAVKVSSSRADFEAYWWRKLDELLHPARPFRSLIEDILRHEFPSFPSPPA